MGKAGHEQRATSSPTSRWPASSTTSTSRSTRTSDPAPRNGTQQRTGKVRKLPQNSAKNSAPQMRLRSCSAEEDTVNGPLHTDDARRVCSGAEFGREGHEPPDLVEINGGASPAAAAAASRLQHAQRKGRNGPEIVAPESDGSLRAYVEREPRKRIHGPHRLVLEGANNEINVTTLEGGKNVEKNRMAGKRPASTCREPSARLQIHQIHPGKHRHRTTYEEEENCGTVYVKGTYAKSLTIAAEDDVIVNGTITRRASPRRSAPAPGTVDARADRDPLRPHLPPLLGRHQRQRAGSTTRGSTGRSCPRATPSSSTTSTAARRSATSTSTARSARSSAGSSAGAARGFTKEYIYDERLATDEPPYFLAPLKAGWKIARETLVKQG